MLSHYVKLGLGEHVLERWFELYVRYNLFNIIYLTQIIETTYKCDDTNAVRNIPLILYQKLLADSVGSWLEIWIY